MVRWLTLGLHLAAAALKSHRNLRPENLALRHQLLVVHQGSKRPRLTPLDRALWVCFSQAWDGWKIRHAEFANGAVRFEVRSARGVRLRAGTEPAWEFRAGLEKRTAEWQHGRPASRAARFARNLPTWGH